MNTISDKLHIPYVPKNERIAKRAVTNLRKYCTNEVDAYKPSIIRPTGSLNKSEIYVFGDSDGFRIDYIGHGMNTYISNVFTLPNDDPFNAQYYRRPIRIGQNNIDLRQQFLPDLYCISQDENALKELQWISEILSNKPTTDLRHIGRLMLSRIVK